MADSWFYYCKVEPYELIRRWRFGLHDKLWLFYSYTNKLIWCEMWMLIWEYWECHDYWFILDSDNTIFGVNFNLENVD